MRWTVRDVKPPFDPLGYVEAPPQEELMSTGFKHNFKLSRWKNDHPRHFEELSPLTVTLELGMFHAHGPRCGCGSCPPGEPAFLSMGRDLDTLRRIVGFHPVTVLRAKPASVGATL